MPNDETQTLKITRIPQLFDFGANRQNKLTVQIVEAIHRMSASEPSAASDYRSSLARLRPQKAEAVRIITGAYKSLSKDRTLDKWSLVHLASELKETTALNLFTQVLVAPITKDAAPCGRGQVAQESVLQATAIEGVRRLAADGSKNAQKILLGATGHGNRTVKRAAIQGYLALGGPDAREKLQASLPKSDHFWLDVRPLRAGQFPWPIVPKTARKRRRSSKPGAPPPRVREKE